MIQKLILDMKKIAKFHSFCMKDVDIFWEQLESNQSPLDIGASAAASSIRL